MQDYIWWSGLTAGDARNGIGLIENELEKALVNEKVYWIARSSQTNPAFKSREAHLLPAYDEYNVAYKDREVVLDHRSNMNTWDMLGPTLSIGGRIVGAWKAAGDRKSTNITLKPTRPLTQPEKVAVKEAVDQYAIFFGSPRVGYSINAANFRGAVD